MIKAGIYLSLCLYSLAVASEGEKMFVREASIEDVDSLACVHSTSWKETYAGLLEEKVITAFSYENRKKMWTKFFTKESQNQKAYVAVHNNTIVGFTSWREDKDSLELLTLYVLSEYQGRGLGRQLFEKITKDKLDKKKNVFLWVLEGNPSCSFYEKMGLVRVKKETKDLVGTLVIELLYQTQ